MPTNILTLLTTKANSSQIRPLTSRPIALKTIILFTRNILVTWDSFYYIRLRWSLGGTSHDLVQLQMHVDSCHSRLQNFWKPAKKTIIPTSILITCTQTNITILPPTLNTKCKCVRFSFLHSYVLLLEETLPIECAQCWYSIRGTKWYG